MRKFLTTLSIAAIAAISLPAFAQADSTTCTDPAVSVTAAQTSVTAGTPVAFTYGFCFDTVAQDYTVQVTQATAQGNVAAQPMQTVALSGSAGDVQSSGSVTPSAAGVYHIIVTYYEQGQVAYQSQGETSVIVTAATVVTPPPAVVTPTPTPTPAPTPAPKPAHKKVVARKKPQGKTRPVDPKLALSKTANVKTITVSGKVIYTLKVKNLGPAAAKNTVVCDSLPAGSLFDSATAHATFKGSQACFKLGTVKLHAVKSVLVTLTLTHAGIVVNHATATATAAKTVKAQATVKVTPKPTTTLAPVTG